MRKTKCLYPEGASPEGMVSASQIQSYMSCAKKWEYVYMQGLTPRVERSYLTIGKLCHRGMEAAMTARWNDPDMDIDMLEGCGLSAMSDMFDDYMESIEYLVEERPEFDKIRTDAVRVFIQSLREFDPLKYEVLTVTRDGVEEPALELHFCIPCSRTNGLHGYIDAILREVDTGHVWCTDYKFRRSLSPDEEEQFNIQNAIYSKACSDMGIDITGTMTWQHSNVPASVPKVNKDGSLSKAKIKTTWDVYLQCIEELGLDPSDYAEMEQKLADNEFWRATKEYRNPDTVYNIWNRIVVPMADAISLRRNSDGGNAMSMYPWNCKMCQFTSLCQAELRGYDVDFIKASEYTQKKHRQ